MKSCQLARTLKKLGLIPVREAENGSVKINLLDRPFLILLSIRCLAIGSYLYFCIMHFMHLKLSTPLIIMLALNIYGTTSTFLVSVVLALAAQRLGTNAFLGSSQMSLKSHLLALIPFLVNITGCILDQSMLFSQQNSWFSNISLFGTLCLINGLGLIDMTGSLFVSFSWISDLKLKINVVLAESTAS